MVLFSEPHPDPTVLLGQGLRKALQGASGRGEGESNPPPLTRDGAVQGEGISQGGASPSAWGLPQREVYLRRLLFAGSVWLSS